MHPPEPPVAPSGLPMLAHRSAWGEGTAGQSLHPSGLFRRTRKTVVVANWGILKGKSQ